MSLWLFWMHVAVSRLDLQSWEVGWNGSSASPRCDSGSHFHTKRYRYVVMSSLLEYFFWGIINDKHSPTSHFHPFPSMFSNIYNLDNKFNESFSRAPHVSRELGPCCVNCPGVGHCLWLWCTFSTAGDQHRACGRRGQRCPGTFGEVKGDASRMRFPVGKGIIKFEYTISIAILQQLVSSLLATNWGHRCFLPLCGSGSKFRASAESFARGPGWAWLYGHRVGCLKCAQTPLHD